MKKRDLGFGFGGSRPRGAKRGQYVAQWLDVVKVEDLNPDTDYWLYVIVARLTTHKAAKDVAAFFNRQRNRKKKK